MEKAEFAVHKAFDLLIKLGRSACENSSPHAVCYTKWICSDAGHLQRVACKRLTSVCDVLNKHLPSSITLSIFLHKMFDSSIVFCAAMKTFTMNHENKQTF